MGDEEEPKLGVSWVQVAGSALAAVSSAVLLSTLGVAGTVIGAAVGSVVATVGTSLYTRTLDVSRQQVAAQATALRRVNRAHEELDDAVSALSRGDAASESRIARAGEELGRAEEVLSAGRADPQDGVPEPDGGGSGDEPAPGVRSGAAAPQGFARALAARLSWQRVAVVAGAVFLVTMVAITAFEMTTGRAVSTYTGGSDRQTGTTVPGLGRSPEPTTPRPSDGATDDDDDGGGEPAADPTDAGSSAPSPTETPSDDPTTSPTLTPTPSPSPSITVPPTASPSSTATGSTGG